MTHKELKCIRQMLNLTERSDVMYANLKKIYDETRLDGFAMAMTYIVDKGWSNVKEITDEEINEM